MKENFASCLADTEIYEGWGKYSNDPVDPGGATFSGITQRAATAWFQAQGRENKTVRKLTPPEISAIAKLQYWDTVRGDELPRGLDLLLFDISFNSGPGKSIKLLQKALGQAQDGIFGLETLGALRRKNDINGLIRSISASRLSFFRSLSSWWHFGRGWTSRVEGIQLKALLLAEPQIHPGALS